MSKEVSAETYLLRMRTASDQHRLQILDSQIEIGARDAL